MSNHQLQGPSNTNNNTLIDTPMEETVSNASTHILSYSEIEATSRDLQEKDVHTQAPIAEDITLMDEDPIEPSTNKGKLPITQTATQTNTLKPLEITVLNDIFKNSTQDSNKAHKGFIPRDSFQPNLSNNEIINLLKTSFIKDNNAFKFEVNTTSTYRYFTIFFKTRDSLEYYIENSPDNIKQVKIYELTNEAINTLIERKFANLDQAVIKIMDIPYNYDTSMLIKHLAIKTGSNIIDHKEVKKPPRRLPNRNNSGRPIFIKPAYKQLIVRFDKQSAYDYFMKENYWSLEIENFVVRVLPGNPDDAEFKRRTSKYFKITGLPLNATAMDIEPLIKHIYGCTCTFTQTTRYSTMKNAYIYVTPENYPNDANNAASSEFEGHKLHIIPGHVSAKTCNTCGSPLHISTECDDKNFTIDRNNRKIFKKRFIDRKSEKITINETHKNRYNHVISLNTNKNSKPTTQDIKRPQPPRNNQAENTQSASLLYPRQNKQQSGYANHDGNRYRHNKGYIPPHLEQHQNQNAPDNTATQRITQLEQQIQVLSNNIKTLLEEKEKSDMKFADLHQSHKNLDSSLEDVKLRLNKYDTIIQQLTTNVTLLSQKSIATPTSPQIRPQKTSKRSTPYEKTSYEKTKSKYNLRSSKQAKTSGEDTETFPATEDDTDYPDDNAMSDGAVFEGIIDDSAYNEPANEQTFTVKSYNPLNLLPGFNVTR
ncbi:hypothetical protein RhiirA4_458198 [Rhizophagus irregularis]|uniref:CCHC-type domain-containing protein n=1 Tax=Rhizophagus irregularis TaxID=588596 RepID=A0A2I1GBN3_9GLOM|nr:hypothetical protein RhiirA4_458198 [Rhizophagus irregularis]